MGLNRDPRGVYDFNNVNLIGAFLFFLEIFTRAFHKVFGPKLSAEEKRKQDEEKRREAWRSVIIGATIIVLAAGLLVLAVRWSERSN